MCELVPGERYFDYYDRMLFKWGAMLFGNVLSTNEDLRESSGRLGVPTM